MGRAGPAGTCVAAVAAGLRPQGDHLPVWLPNGPEALLLWFAANWLGAVQVPSNIGYRGRILEHVPGIAGAALMVAGAALLDLLRDVALPQVLRRIAGFAAGGTLDIVARLVAEGMSPLLGQRVVAGNRPGEMGPGDPGVPRRMASRTHEPT